MWLIVGLGNPDQKYQNTRHNIGFMFIDYCKDNLPSDIHIISKKECKSQTYHIKSNGEHLILCQPLTYMNLSGLAVQALMTYYKIPLAHLLVVHDEMDLPFGICKFQKNRGAASHNGVQHIHDQLGSKDYIRLRFGIGKSQGHLNGRNYVLSHFSKEEQEKLPLLMKKIKDSIEDILKKGFEQTTREIQL